MAASGDAGTPGVTALAFAHIFRKICETPDVRYNVSLSIMEIYQASLPPGHAFSPGRTHEPWLPGFDTATNSRVMPAVG